MPMIGPLLIPGERERPGGAETQVLLLATELARRGWRVALITYAVQTKLPNEVDGVRVIVQHSHTGLRSRLARSLLHFGNTLRIMVRVRPWVLVQRGAGAATGAVALISRLVGCRFVYASASVIDFDFGSLESSAKAVRLFHLGIRLADTVVVQTEEQHRLCTQRFAREGCLIGSLAERQAPREVEPEAFLWIGRAADYKRPEAFVDLARAVPEAHFWMVAFVSGGSGDELLDQLKRAAAGLPNLELLEPRPRQRLGKLIARAVAVVNTADHEGMPNIFLEGWARGVPALALSHDPDGVIQHHGLGAFAGGSSAVLIDQTGRLWADRKDQASVAARCRAYVADHHDIAAITDRWEVALALPSRTAEGIQTLPPSPQP
jgi:glycosyltransferase involved in cell wall biosynthesis